MEKIENNILKKIKITFKIDGILQRNQRIWVSVESNRLIELCQWLKDEGFVHLSAISATDWLEEGLYEITYHLWSYNEKVLLTVKTKIDRNNPLIDSVVPIWSNNAQIHERELHELFGVKFRGNPDLSQLFLEDWEGPPPFRKDFDWREYLKKEVFDPKNKREQVYYDKTK